MKIFEFQFNPRARKERIFKVLSLEGGKGQRAELGSLAFIGELDNVLPSNLKFLDVFAEFVSSDYFAIDGAHFFASPHAKLKQTLAKANTFLEQEIRRGNVDWVGNLHIALVVVWRKPNSSVEFASLGKCGNMKLYLGRQGALIDLEKQIAASKEIRDSSKTFPTTFSGRVFPEDKILVLTKDLADVFFQENLLQDLAFLKERKQFDELLGAKKKMLSRNSGILFSIVMEDEKLPESEAGRRIIEKLLPSLSFRFPVFAFPSLRFSLPKFANLPLLPRINTSRFRDLRRSLNELFFKTRFSPLFILLVLLLAGFLIFQRENRGFSSDTRIAFQRAQTLAARAEGLLASGDMGNGSLLFLEAWDTLSKAKAQKKTFPKEMRQLLEHVERKLLSLHGVEDVETPELFFDAKEIGGGLVPQRMLFGGGRLYLSHPFSERVLSVEAKLNTWEIFSLPGKVKEGIVLGNVVVYFGEPNALFSITGFQAVKEILLALPFGKTGERFAVDALASFENKLYVLNGKTGEIVRYANPLAGNATPVSWLAPAAKKKAQGAEAIAVDGDVWLLKDGKELQRYFQGMHQESLNPRIFPPLSLITRIKTASEFAHLYLLEPAEKRIIVLTRAGKVVKQYRSSAFDNLLDFAVSDDEETLYVLNGTKVFRIQNTAGR